jgi:7-cyano-7-deazaguanine reductase
MKNVANRTVKHNEGEDFQPLDKRFDVQDISVVDVGTLATFPYEYPGKDITVNIETDEFTAVCPWSGLPDFATIKIDYIPDRLVIELRSLKYYLLSYRNAGAYQEHVVNKILEDLVQVCQPKWMKVTADYKIRGGIHTVASREYHGSK